MNKIIHPIEPEELMAYLDGELTGDRATEAAAHLRECAECQSLAAELQNVSQNLKAWEVEPSESAMPSAVATTLAERGPASLSAIPVSRPRWRDLLRRRWPVLAWAGTAAGIVLVVFGTFTEHKRIIEPSRVQVSLQPPASPMPDKKALEFSAGLIGGNPRQQARTIRSMSANTFAASDQQDKSEASEPQSPTSSVPPVHGPMIIRTAQLSLITKEFDKARANLEAILKRHRGYVGELKAGGATGSGRTLTATLRVPADQLDATLTEVKTLGRVESESQSGQDVTSQYVDLQARFSNARNTEQRLTDLLRNRTGKLSDVLEVEQELDRVRGEIEQMEAERKNMSTQVSFATLNATITEDYKAELQVVPPSTSTRLSNAAIEGYRSMVDGVVSLALFLLSNGPTLLLWGAVLFMPARLVWKKLRRSLAA